ncbi:MAG: amidohydrolase family protein, partial [Alphaproteobacteria bacterium]|nr:amidohydrolase family protein [Alphaproteobacteria bacterium]
RGQRVDTSLVQGVAGQGPYNWFLRVIADRYPDAFNVTPPFSDAGVTEVATCPNVVLKLGGIGMPMFGTTWHERDIQPGPDEVAAHWGDAVRSCIDTFGPDRCMFESNFAVDRISMTYATAWAAFDLISQTYSPAERAALFHDTAVRTYRLDRQDTA